MMNLDFVENLVGLCVYHSVFKIKLIRPKNKKLVQKKAKLINLLFVIIKFNKIKSSEGLI